MVAPLFVADNATLLARLRLSGLAAGTDGMQVVDQAIRDVRASFYRRLTSNRITKLLGYTQTDAPTTTNEVLRTVADSTEVKWVRYELLRTLPALWMDGSGGNAEVWQNEGAFRQMSPSAIASERKKLKTDIEQALDLLAGRTSVGSETSIRVSSIAADGTRPYPGHSIDPAWPVEECDE